jgi:hypothetical protein
MERLAQDFINAIGGLAASLIPWWVPYAFWGFVAVVGLVVVLLLVKLLKDTVGWPGVVAGLLTVVALASGAFGFAKGKEWAEKRRPAPVPGKPRKTLFPRK